MYLIFVWHILFYCIFRHYIPIYNVIFARWISNKTLLLFLSQACVVSILRWRSSRRWWRVTVLTPTCRRWWHVSTTWSCPTTRRKTSCDSNWPSPRGKASSPSTSPRVTTRWQHRGGRHLARRSKAQSAIVSNCYCDYKHGQKQTVVGRVSKTISRDEHCNNYYEIICVTHRRTISRRLMTRRVN